MRTLNTCGMHSCKCSLALPVFLVVAAFGGLTGTAAANTCKCTNMSASSSANGTCTRTQTANSCKMSWNGGSSSVNTASSESPSDSSGASATHQSTTRSAELLTSTFPDFRLPGRLDDPQDPLVPRINQFLNRRIFGVQDSTQAVNSLLVLLGGAVVLFDETLWQSTIRSLASSSEMNQIEKAVISDSDSSIAVQFGQFQLIVSRDCIEQRLNDSLNFMVKSEFSPLTSSCDPSQER